MIRSRSAFQDKRAKLWSQKYGRRVRGSLAVAGRRCFFIRVFSKGLRRLDGGVSREEVGHDEAVETPLLPQNLRQREGIELAKKEGKFKGRLKKDHKNHAGMNYAVKLYKEGNMTVNQICEITNVSRASF